jgi:hypothetical protein
MSAQVSDITTKILEEFKASGYPDNEGTKALSAKIIDIVRNDDALKSVAEPESVDETSAPMEESAPVNRDIKSNIRLFITNKPNSRGSYISGYDVIINADEYPFTSADEVSAVLKQLLGNPGDNGYLYTPSSTEQITKADAARPMITQGGKKKRSKTRKHRMARKNRRSRSKKPCHAKMPMILV